MASMTARPRLRQEHRGPLLEELAKAIAALPEEARQPQWHATLQVVEQLPSPLRASLFDPVAVRIGALPAGALAAAFESLLQAHGRLPAQDYVQSVAALGTACLARPRAQWLQVLGQVLAESERIPEPEQRAASLLLLARKFCLAEPATYAPIAPAQPGLPAPDVRLECLHRVIALLPALPHPPAWFGEFVNVLNDDVEQRLQQQPDEAAFLTEVRERLRGLRRSFSGA